MTNSDEQTKTRKLLSPEERIEMQKALQKAKELEKKKIPGAKHEVNELKNLIEESEQAKKLLKPVWYLKSENKNKIKKK